jgi:methionyl-tRNA formyltransferase
MRIVVLTNGSTHGRRILEELKRNRIPVAGVVVEQEPAPPRPPLSTCLERLGYQTTASVLYRDFCERLWPNLPALRYRRFAKAARRVTNFNSEQCRQVLIDLRSDLIILGGARILKRHILECAKIAVLNAHPGLLPSYRGNDVIAWALYNGDPVGVTVHVVDAGIDTGAIINTRELSVVKGQSIKQLKLKAEDLAAVMISEVVRDVIATGRITPMPPSGVRGPLYRVMPPEMREALDRKLSAG